MVREPAPLLRAAHSANATMALVAEEFGGTKVPLDRIARVVEGAILKSTAEGRPHGVVVLAPDTRPPGGYTPYKRVR